MSDFEVKNILYSLKGEYNCTALLFVFVLFILEIEFKKKKDNVALT